jgi:pyruvate dehydrogenase E2 component (dihydrolipoamide acetyltransferase)
MSIPVVMPQLGLTMKEGSVSEWLKRPGELVRKGDMLFIVSTDKADMEVESLDEGNLTQIVVQPGNVVPVGTVIAYLGRPGEDAVAAPAQTAAAPLAQTKKEQTPDAAAAKALSASTTAQAPEGGLPSSPRARKLARDLGVDISKVPPSGRRERIVEDDVRQFAAARKPELAQTPATDARRRRVIAERLTQSIQTIPHFSLSVEVRADQLVALRESLKGPVMEQTGLKLTVTDLLLKALALALQETPGVRAVWEAGNLRAVEALDLGLAIAAETGVVAPVIRNVAALDLAGIARWRHEVMDKVRGGRLALTDLEGGIGTLSNLGSYRVDHFQAIISPGQSFILAVGRIERRPWVEAGELIVAQTLNLTLSVDHRVADGALAAQFLGKIAAIIENPYRLLWSPEKSKPSPS